MTSKQFAIPGKTLVAAFAVLFLAAVAVGAIVRHDAGLPEQPAGPAGDGLPTTLTTAVPVPPPAPAPQRGGDR